MTEDQIERAAMALCRLRDQDPDELVGHAAQPDQDGWVPAIALFSPRWKLAASEIVAAHQVQQAIAEATTAGPDFVKIEERRPEPGPWNHPA